MADKSFGVKELNLLNASGTPTVTSPNNLNLNANTVAISTSCTIGSNLDVDGTTNLDNVDIVGITTIRNASGNKLYEGSANASKLFHNGSERLQTETYGIDINGTLGADQINCSGVSTITVPANANPHSSWDVVNNSASSYRFTGPGQDGAEDNPNIYLVRGQRYVFKMNASGHPFQIRVANGGAAYSDGVTNNGAQTGNVVFNVQHDAPAQLFYQCTSHGSMVGNIYIIGGPQVISGVVTATTFVGNLTGTASANAVLTGSTNDQLVTVTGANAITGESALTYANNILKNEVSDSSGLGAHILVNNSESSAGISLLGSGSSFSSGGWAAVTDAGIIRSSAGAANGLVLQAASGDLKFFAGGNPSAERVRITSGGYVNIGADFTQSTHMLYLASTGDAGIHIRADSDNSGENDNPYLSMSQDGSVAQQLKLGMVGDSGSEFAQSIANGVFLHANTANAQPLQLAHADNLAVFITNTEQSHLHSYSGNSTGGMKIANRGNDTAAALLLQGHNNSGGTPGQATNTQLTHKGANATFNIRHLGTDRLVIGSTGVVSGDLNDTSDIALKKDIESISTSCIDNIKQLNPVTFKWKDTSRKDIGFIAQEVEDILPDLVNGEDGVKSINTIGLVSQLTKALQEAITEIETLKTKIAALPS